MARNIIRNSSKNSGVILAMMISERGSRGHEQLFERPGFPLANHSRGANEGAIQD